MLDVSIHQLLNGALADCIYTKTHVDCWSVNIKPFGRSVLSMGSGLEHGFDSLTDHHVSRQFESLRVHLGASNFWGAGVAPETN